MVGFLRTGVPRISDNKGEEVQDQTPPDTNVIATSTSPLADATNLGRINRVQPARLAKTPSLGKSRYDLWGDTRYS